MMQLKLQNYHLIVKGIIMSKWKPILKKLPKIPTGEESVDILVLGENGYFRAVHRDRHTIDIPLSDATHWKYIKPVKNNKKDIRFDPEENEEYTFVDMGGVPFTTTHIKSHAERRLYNHFNCFESEEQAEEVAIQQRQFNALAMACVLCNKGRTVLNPDGNKYIFRKSQNGWNYELVDGSYALGEPCVYFPNTAKKVIKLLSKWSV